MCGRYAIPDEAAVERLCAADFRRGFSWMRPLFNVAPTTQVPVIVQAPDGAQEIQGARWGLIPSWWQKDTPPPLTFNARAEEAATKPMWRDSFKTSRCLMPALGWYEWNPDQPLPAKSGRQRGQPYFISCPGTEAIAFAGLRAVWPRPGAAPVASCAVLTTKAAADIAFIHPRMPVVLKPEHYRAWLDAATTAGELQDILAAAQAPFAARPVSPRVNSVRNDSPDLIERVPVHTTDSLLPDA
jgi:putative SOS response-associated peptidase YedK